jgi:hypothetical protein
MTPLHVICARLRRLPLRLQAEHLKVLVDAEKPRSVRRGELESMLKDVNLRRLKHEKRSAA